MVSTVIAVIGTLLGAIASGLLQHRAAHSVRVEARDDQRRAEQLAAVTDLAVAVSDHRRAMWEVTDAKLTDQPETRVTELRDESHRTRSCITAPAVRVRLLIEDQAVRAAATEAVQATYRMRDAADLAELEAMRQTALATHDAMIEAAARYLAA
ncbi:pRL2-23 [Streptomyces bluensis]|uniref:pRL2-23 n=1 Tax=Streptomyces bluensis TaxID=33897 RepID=UPI003326A742